MDACALCGCQRFDIVSDRLRDDDGRFKVYACARCGHVQVFPLPTAEENEAFYDRNLQDKGRNKTIDYNILYENNRFDTRRHVDFVRGIVRDVKAKILDIGTGYGFFVRDMYEAGYRNIAGAELSDERRELARGYTGAEIHDYDVCNPNVDIGTFDAVTLFHVLEHVADPVSFLAAIRKLLGRGACFICEVPNVRELLLETCPAYRNFYWIRAHLHYFSETALCECFKKAGFGHVDILFQQRYGIVNMVNWITTGKPQIDKPVFTIDESYGWLEACYRSRLEREKRSDALVAVARVRS